MRWRARLRPDIRSLSNVSARSLGGAVASAVRGTSKIRDLRSSVVPHIAGPPDADLPANDPRLSRTTGTQQGCALLQPYDMEVGAGTSHTATFLRAIGPEPWRAAYVQPSRRPKDGRYGENPNRLQHYYQYQVVLKPSPLDILDLYLGSLEALGIDPQAERHPLRRGRLGKSDARRVGPGLGSVAERHGSHAVHVFPAGRRPRLQTDYRRDHLRPRAPGDVPAGRGKRYSISCGRRDGVYLPRRLPPERSRAVDVQLRACRTPNAVRALRQLRERSEAPDGRRSLRCRPTRWC